MIKKKHFVLFSGGLDSTVVLFNVLDALKGDGGDEIEAVGVDYGQRHVTELEHAQAICKQYGIPYDVIDVPDELMAGTLLASDREIKSQKYSDINGMSPTYVPFRNGLMLSLLAAKAQKWVMENEHETRSARIYIGSHAEDAANDAYPDCSIAFMSAMGQAIKVGTYGMVELVTPLIAMNKMQVIKYGTRVQTPFSLTWSCYKGERVHCGKCMTCNARHDGFAAADIDDPTTYAA